MRTLLPQLHHTSNTAHQTSLQMIVVPKMSTLCPLSHAPRRVPAAAIMASRSRWKATRTAANSRAANATNVSLFCKYGEEASWKWVADLWSCWNMYCRLRNVGFSRGHCSPMNKDFITLGGKNFYMLHPWSCTVCLGFASLLTIFLTLNLINIIMHCAFL